jgi:hypothetical protein
MLKNSTTYVYALLAIVIVGIIVLSAVGKTVPAELYGFGAALLGGGLGITNPTTSTAVPTATPAAPVPAQSLITSAQTPVTVPVATAP